MARPTPPLRKLDTFRAFSHRDYRLYWTGMIISQTGSWMQVLGQQWLVLQLTNSPLWLGVIGFCSSIPVLLLSMVAGVVCDRVNKRHLILLTQIAATIQALVLAVLTSTGKVQIWHVAVCALALGTINAFDRPARQTFVVELVGKDDLVNAIALNSTIFNGSRIFGPAIAGIMIAIPQIGPAGAFYINALSFLAVIVGLLMMNHKPLHSPVRSQSVRTDIVEGLSYARTNSLVYTLMFMASITSVFGMSYATMMPIMAKDVLKVGASGQGVMMTCVGVGALAGSLALASFSNTRRKGLIFLGANLLFPPTLIIVALSRSFPLTLVTLLVLGFAMIVQNAMTNTLLQTEVPDHLRGRVMGLYNLTFNGMTPFGSLQAGVVANAFGAPAALLVGGIVCFSRSLLMARSAMLRKLE